MIRSTLTADGTGVRVAIRDHITAPLLDDLAITYAEGTEPLDRLLFAHAAAVLALDYVACSEDAPEYERAMRAAEADATREALLDALPVEHQLDPLLSADEAVTFAARLTKFAAHIRHTNPKPRPLARLAARILPTTNRSTTK
ncbi:hypothetical protein ACH4JZ_18500 [Streptomyces sp. NPDC017615]|uniref:hypothetical protein n=1 Tax=Streptomyces sp. NPDC017615 TaxID=3365003 RepID=UPI0037A082B3